MSIVGEQSQVLDQTAQPGQAEITASQIPGNNQSEPQLQNDPAQGYVTKAELDALKKEMLKSMQSNAGKLEQRITERMEKLKAAGIPATTESVQRLIEAEEEQANESKPQAPIPQGTQQVQATQPGTQVSPATDPVLAQAATWMQEDGLSNPNPITAEAYRMMALENVRITDDDPESKSIGGQTAFDFLASLKAAMEAKRQRLDLKGTPGRTPGISSGSPTSAQSHENKRGLETLNQYFRGK